MKNHNNIYIRSSPKDNSIDQYVVNGEIIFELKSGDKLKNLAFVFKNVEEEDEQYAETDV